MEESPRALKNLCKLGYLSDPCLNYPDYNFSALPFSASAFSLNL